MRPVIKIVLQYVLLFGITVLLIGLALRNLDPSGDKNRWDYIWATWRAADKGWLVVMAVIAVVSHWIRAVRWRVLLIPTGHTVRTSYSLLSLLIGYLVNLAVPRGGEVSRCYNLNKLEGTPIEISFGTVVAERVVDLVCLILLLILSLAVEWSLLLPFIERVFAGPSAGLRAPLWVWLLVPAALFVVGLVWYFRGHPKVVGVLAGFKAGLLSVFKLDHPIAFLVQSLTIWSLYFVMSYCVLQAFPETRNLGGSAVLGLFAIGSVAMAAPLPGGAGSYHVLVPLGLTTLYGIESDVAIAFTFVFHGWQTAVMIAGGVISLLISYFITRWKKPPIRSVT